MIEIIKNVTNIFFFVAVAIVTILSYGQARKTLFAPIRTETFKLQLKAFEEILAFFQNKTETDFLDAFDFNRIVSLNALQMADSYVSNFFAEEISIDKEARKAVLSPLIGAIVSKDYMENFFEMADKEKPVHKPPLDEKKIKNPAIILATWQKYEYGMVGYTKEFDDQLKELTRLAASPLLPKPLRDHIGEFRVIAHDNLAAVGHAVTTCAKLMPEHFPVASDIKEFSPTWVWNDFNDRRISFEPVAKAILEYMNDYLKIENLMQ